MAFILTLLALSLLLTSTSSHTIDGSKYHKPDAGPPASLFTAKASMPVSSLQTAAAQLSTEPKHGSYKINFDTEREAVIHDDWASFDEVFTLHIRLNSD